MSYMDDDNLDGLEDEDGPPATPVPESFNSYTGFTFGAAASADPRPNPPHYDDLSRLVDSTSNGEGYSFDEPFNYVGFSVYFEQPADISQHEFALGQGANANYIRQVLESVGAQPVTAGAREILEPNGQRITFMFNEEDLPKVLEAVREIEATGREAAGLNIEEVPETQPEPEQAEEPLSPEDVLEQLETVKETFDKISAFGNKMGGLAGGNLSGIFNRFASILDHAIEQAQEAVLTNDDDAPAVDQEKTVEPPAPGIPEFR